LPSLFRIHLLRTRRLGNFKWCLHSSLPHCKEKWGYSYCWRMHVQSWNSWRKYL